MKNFFIKGKFVFLGLTILICLLFFFKWSKSEAPFYPDEAAREKRWQVDLDFFENEYLPNSRTFPEDSIATCKATIKSIRNNISNLKNNEIILELSRMVSMANNGHTTIHLSKMQKIPLRFYWFADGLYVIKSDKASKKYLGSKVLAINGRETERVFKELKPYLSGIDNFKRFIATNYLNSPEILEGIGLSENGSLLLNLLKDNDTTEVKFDVKKAPDTRYEYETWADLYPSPKEDEFWSHLLPKERKLPLYLENMEEGVSHAFLKKEKIAYFSINALWYKCNDFKSEIKEFLSELKNNGDYDVVIDLRYYTGGNFLMPTDLASKIPSLLGKDKKIYLITSNKTFSAGLITAARIKYFAKGKAIIVGENVGDNLKFWAEGEYFELPYSKVVIQDSKYEHDWADNTFTIGKTFWVNAFYGVAAKSIEVDKKISLSFNDYLNYEDPIFNWIVAQKSIGTTDLQ